MAKRIEKKPGKSHRKAEEPRAGMARTRRSFTEKLRPDMAPSRTKDPRDGKSMLIPTPLLVAAEIRATRRGRLVTVSEIRDRLAKRHRTEKTCPLVTGIFLSILAGASEEALAVGRKPIAPWWRVVDDKGRLLEKAPPGVVRQAALLAAEGVIAVPSGRGGKLTVMGFEARG